MSTVADLRELIKAVGTKYSGDLTVQRLMVVANEVLDGELNDILSLDVKDPEDENDENDENDDLNDIFNN